MEVVLSKRMETVVSMVLPQSIIIENQLKEKQAFDNYMVADVGCDHAYVSIALVRRGIAQKVIAMDVRKGPLEIATRNVQEYGLSDAIELRLSDGLEKLSAGEVNTVVIAGMGGLLIRRILQEGLYNFGKELCKEQEKMYRPILVLQPQSDLCAVREFLLDHDYIIDCEKMLFEEGKFYQVLRAIPLEMVEQSIENERSGSKYNDAELLYGRYGLQHKDMVLYDFLKKENVTLLSIIEKLEGIIGSAKQENRVIPEKTLNRFEDVCKQREVNEMALLFFE